MVLPSRSSVYRGGKPAQNERQRSQSNSRAVEGGVCPEGFFSGESQNFSPVFMNSHSLPTGRNTR